MLAQNILSIDIGSATTKLVLGRHQGKSIKLLKTVIIHTPSQCYSDGNLLAIPKLVAKIKEALIVNKIKAKKVIITVNSTSIITREISFPSVKPEEMAEMIKFDIEQYMPISIDEYDIEHKILEEYEDEGGKKTKVLVAAVQKTMVISYINLVKELGLTPIAIDITSNSASKLFENTVMINTENYNAEGIVALIDMGYRTITVNFLVKGRLQFSRVIPRGGNELEEIRVNEYVAATSETSISSNGKIDLSVDSELVNISKTVIDSWLQEVQRILQYYSSRSNKNNIEKVFLYGGYSGIQGIEDYFKNSINLPVVDINTMDIIKMSVGIKTTDIKNCLNAIGSLIRR